jgi:acid phosphatase type 7
MSPAHAGGSDDPDNPVLVGAGDIARCYSSDDRATANLLENIPGTVFTAGDNSQDYGAPSQYTNCFDRSWGRYKDRIRPAPGNHDYMTPGASGYYGYFGEAAGEPGKGYYSYDLGSWHVVSLNSNCAQIGGCGVGSEQEQWLRDDLEANTLPCTAAYWHQPLFTSSVHPPTNEVRPLFQALYDHGAEIVMNGHNHVYERFAPQDPMGQLDEELGIREFDVGTGGAGHYWFGGIARNSEVRNNDTYGVLKLTLKDSGYDWEFVPVEGGTFTDSGSGVCH